MTTPQKLVIFHKNCADGFLAAFIAWLAFGDDNAEYVSADYGDPIPDLTGKEVYILDFSYKPELLIEAAKAAAFVVMLDHHKSALNNWLIVAGDADKIDGCESFETNAYKNLLVRIDMDHSGAGLAWNRWKGELMVQAQGQNNRCTGVMHVLEDIVQAVQDRDLWWFKLPLTKVICAGLSFAGKTFQDYQQYLRRHTPITLATLGEVVLSRNQQICESIAERAINAVFMGQDPSVPVVNCNKQFASEVGHILDEEHPYSITYEIMRDIAVVSLRSREGGADVSVIAEHFGGGGHKHAAGFKLRVDEFFALLTF